MATAVVSARIPESDKFRLSRLARRSGRTESDVAATIIHEALECGEFPHIEFRDSSVGRQAYLKGSRLAVWQVEQLARRFNGSPEEVANHLERPFPIIQAALNYAQAHTEEIDLAIADSESMDFEGLKRLLPGIELYDLASKGKGGKSA